MNLGLGGILTIMLRKGFHADDTEFVEKNRTQLKSIVKQIEQDWIGMIYVHIYKFPYVKGNRMADTLFSILTLFHVFIDPYTVYSPS